MFINDFCGRSSAGRVLASQASDRGFEPRRPLQGNPNHPAINFRLPDNLKTRG